MIVRLVLEVVDDHLNAAPGNAIVGPLRGSGGQPKRPEDQPSVRPLQRVVITPPPDGSDWPEAGHGRSILRRGRLLPGLANGPAFARM